MNLLWWVFDLFFQKMKIQEPNKNVMKAKFLLVRSQRLEKETLGNLFIISDSSEVLFQCKTLELPWKDNKRSISCIPPGLYDIELSLSPKYGMAWELVDVPNRSEIKIHNGNFHYQIEGCILVGSEHKDINTDLLPDVFNSYATRLKMEKVLADLNINKTTIKVISI